jgi:hypothetical protein
MDIGNIPKSVTIVRMEVPCCGCLELAAKKALQASGKFIPWQVVTISLDGRIIDSLRMLYSHRRPSLMYLPNRWRSIAPFDGETTNISTLRSIGKVTPVITDMNTFFNAV